MSIKTGEILEKIKGLNWVEKNELVKQVEKVFHVTATRQQLNRVSEIVDFLITEEVAENNKFDVVLIKFPPDKKISTMLIVRNLLEKPLTLKELKTFVESLPQVIRHNVSRDVAEEIKQQLETTDATVFLV